MIYVERVCDMSEYDETKALINFIFNHRPQYLTAAERRVNQAGMARLQAETVAANGSEALARRMLETWGEAGNPEVESALSEGLEAFRARAVGRVLEDPIILESINRCPGCRRVVRTPQAQQCFWCGHDWHRPTV